MKAEFERPNNSTIPLTDVIVEAPQTIRRDGRRTPIVLLVGAIILAGALSAWVHSTGSDEPTPVEVTDDDETDIEAVDQESEETPNREERDNGASSRMAEDMATGAMMEGPGQVVFDEGRFVALGYGPHGQTIRTSGDGIDWDEALIDGLPLNAHIRQLAVHNGAYAALVEQWNEEQAEPEFFGTSDGPNISIAHSTDLVSWTLTPVQQADVDGVHTEVSALAVIDGTVVLVSQQYPLGPNEARLLFEAGLLDEDSIERYCGLRFAENDIIQVQECNHDSFQEPDERLFIELEERWNAATTDEERAALEAELENLWGGPEGEVVAEIQPGSALHIELSKIYNGEYEQEFRPTITMLSGPLGGDLDATPLPASGYVNSLVRSGDRLYMMIMDSENGSAQMMASTDGRRWDKMTSPAGQIFEGSFYAGGDSLLFAGHQGEGGPSLMTSSDGGTTWVESVLSTNLHGAYPVILGGPAGYVAALSGTDEPIDYGEPESIQVTRDGYTLTTRWAENGESVTLTGPDGNVVYELTPEDLYDEGSELVRTNPFSGTPTFLDPETGDELVSFTSEDYEASYAQMEESFSGVEPNYTTELYHSVDGVNWTMIDDDRLSVDPMPGNLSPIAVGDDEAVFAKHRWIEPDPSLFAFEEEGREPTEQELSALQAWEMSAGAGSVQYIRIELGS